MLKNRGNPSSHFRKPTSSRKSDLRSFGLGDCFVNFSVLCGARIFLPLILAICFIPAPAFARIRTHHSQSAPDAEYVSALAVANKFLFAWQSHDEEAGLLLLTDAVKKSSTEDKVATFFTSAPLATYEIGRGKKLKPGLYVFPLALYKSEPGKDKLCPPHYSQLNVIRTGKEDWAIDKLP
jgi:hypothetical protein